MPLVPAPFFGDLAWEWARPAGLWALVLPGLVWLLSRLRAQPPAVATGTLALWKRIASSHPQRAAGQRRRTPPWIWCVLLALGLGALALAGPRLVPPAPPVTWTVVVDHSPSTSLLLESRETRLESALERARTWLEVHARPADRVRWISSAHATLDLAAGEAPPGRWMLHPGWLAPAPRWELFDTPGTLWVTDAAPSSAPEQAGLFASGGELVPGAVSAEGTTAFVWDGERITREENALASRALVLAPGEPLPEPVASLARLWAAERGLRVAESDRGEALRLEAVTAGDTVALQVARDGWRARVRGSAARLVPLETRAPQESWLFATGSDVGAAALVHASPGRIRLAFTEMEPPEGDPAAFAYSWSRLFERWLLPAPGIVPLEERGAAGESILRAPTPPGVERRRVAGELAGDDVDAWLAASAALLAAVALSVGLRRG